MTMREKAVPEELVSVVIPTYRRSTKYLSRAVESVRNQTYRNLEIIIVDDSTEEYPLRAETEMYIQSLADDRVRYYQNEKNLGSSLTRNRGIEYATGKYVTFLDDDDEYLPQKVEKQVLFMETGGYDMSFSEMAMFTEDGRLSDYRSYEDMDDFSSEGLFRYHLMRHLTGTPSFMFRRDKLLEIGCFDDIVIGEEFYLTSKAIGGGLRIGYHRACDVKVHLHSNERLSVGDHKIAGENALYEYKKTFFHLFSAKERRFMRFRHYAVIAVSYLRSGEYGKMLIAGLKAFFGAPGIFFCEVFGFLKKILRSRETVDGKQKT